MRRIQKRGTWRLEARRIDTKPGKAHGYNKLDIVTDVEHPDRQMHERTDGD